jgi:Acyl-coenzyme A:6-aminopenicillanic acid acyl-transferase
MHINYDIPTISKFVLYGNIGFLHGFRHIFLGIKGNELGLSALERISHVAIGIFKMIPVIGNIFTLIHKKINKIVIKELDLRDTEDPYLRGVHHGEKFRKEIQELYSIILTSRRTSLADKWKELHARLSNDLKAEIRGLAKGAGVSEEDVIMIHTFLDISPGEYGCTALAVKKTEQETKAIAAANHSIKDSEKSNDIYSGSIDRRTKMLEAKDKTPHEILKASNVKDTIHSIIFNPSEKSIKLAVGENKAAKKKFKIFKPFQNKRSSDEKVLLIRNLDWPWYFLAQNTLLLTRKINGKIITSVTFPGFLGSLSGMNEDGLSLAACQRGFQENNTGTPCTLFFTELLSKCSNIAEARRYINSHKSASSMNLVIADKNDAISVELNPEYENEIVEAI